VSRFMSKSVGQMSR